MSRTYSCYRNSFRDSLKVGQDKISHHSFFSTTIFNTLKVDFENIKNLLTILFHDYFDKTNKLTNGLYD